MKLVRDIKSECFIPVGHAVARLQENQLPSE